MPLKSKTPLRSKVRLKSKAALNSKTHLKSKKQLTSKTNLKSSSCLKSGKKTSQWEEFKVHLKDKFKNVFKITSCEAKLPNCWNKTGLTFAHAEKRRFLTDDTMGDVILCCINCHTIIEQYPHKEMYDFVYGIINKRSRGNNDKSS